MDIAGTSKSRNFLQTSRKTLLQWQYNLLPSYVPLNFWSIVKKTIVQTYFRVWNHFQLFDFGQIDHSDVIVPQFQSNSVVIQWIQSVFLPLLLWFLKNCMCFPYSLPSKRYSILNNYTVGKFCCYLLLPFLCWFIYSSPFHLKWCNTLFRSVQVYNKFYITDKQHYSVYFLLNRSSYYLH